MSIFISIASYKDPETIPTILDCYNKSKFKDNLRFGVLLQEDKNFSKKDKLSKDINVDFLDYDWRDSQGTCWARHSIQKLLFNKEDYYLQLDSHHRFCENWDEILLNQLAFLNNKFDKPIIGGYCPEYNPSDTNLKDRPMRIVSYPEFTNLGDLMFSPKIIPNYKDLRSKDIQYINARFLSGHFIFTNGDFIKDCIYDPLLYFRGEELSLSARAYTHGYDFFHPTQSIVWHEYIRANQTKHWDDHTDTKGFLITSKQRAIKAKERVRQLLGMEKCSINFGKYGLGNKRSLHEYELYAGLDFKNKSVHKYAYDLTNDSPDPYVLTEKEWLDGMMKEFIVQFDLPDNFVGYLIDNECCSFGFICYDSSDKIVYRKDIKKEKYIKYLTKTTQLVGNMLNKPEKITIIPFVDENKFLPHIEINTIKII